MSTSRTSPSLESMAAAAPPPRRVLLLIWAGILRGAERHVVDLAAILPGHGYVPTVCFFSSADTYGPVLREAGIDFVELHNRSTKLDVRGIFGFARLLREGNFHVVHDHGVSLWARVVVRIVARGVPVVYTEHITRFTSLRRLAYKLVQPFTDAHVAVSEAARHALVRQLGVAEDRVTVIPNSVNPERFASPTDVSRRGVRRRLALPEESVILTSIGRLTASKQFGLLIDSLAALLGRRTEVHLLIAGEGEARLGLEAQIRARNLAGQVHLLGNRHDIPDILGASDIFVFTSREESFGIAVAEAMLAGLPVVALAIPGVEEVVESQVTGTLIEPANIDVGFAAAVEALLDDSTLRSAFGTAGRARAEALFSPDLMASRLVAVYDATLERRRAKIVP